MKNFGDRLNFLIKNVKRMTLRELANKIIKEAKNPEEIITENLLSHYVNNRRKPPFDKLKIIAKVLDAPIGYFFGEYDVTPEGYFYRIGGDYTEDGFFTVPLIQARVSAGGGSVEFNYVEDTDFERYAFRKDYIKRVATSPENLFLTRVMGDSMYPTLKDGDIVLVDRGKKQIQDNKIYVVRAGDEVYIKRLIKIPTGTIKVKSDNPNYPEYEIKTDEADFEVIGKVIWAGVSLE